MISQTIDYDTPTDIWIRMLSGRWLFV